MVSRDDDVDEEDLSSALEPYMQIASEPEPKKPRVEAPDAEEVSPVPDTHAASEPTLSCEPGLVPAADAGSQDAALGFLMADSDSEEPEQESKQPLEQTVVTPLLSADAVVELMADTAPDDIIWQAEKIRQGIKLVFPDVDDSTVQDEDLVEITKSEQVVCASGESDRESIRDFDSGTGRFRWNRRSPYWFKRELCADEDEQGMKYRRRMKPAVAGSSLVWKPEYPDNEDGSNEQPSFALSAQIGTDEAGRITGTHRDVQPVSYTGQSEDLWQQMWGTRFTDSNTNSMLALTDKYRVVRKIETITDDQVDEKLLDEILDDFQGIAVTRGVPHALEELFLLLRRGMNKQAVGIKRVPDKCGHCEGDLFTPEGGADSQICPFCNCWLHKTCAETHMVQHVKGILCRGSRRWKDRKTTKDANAGADYGWIIGSGFAQGAPAVPAPKPRPKAAPKPKPAPPVRSAASSRFGNLEDGLTMMPADYDEEDSVRSPGDPMAEFHAERPVVPRDYCEKGLSLMHI